MMRYRSAMMEPGVKPPAGTESDEIRRPIRGAGTGTDEPAAAVDICEGEPIACPQERQKRLSAGISAEHDGHSMINGVMVILAVALRVQTRHLPGNDLPAIFSFQPDIRSAVPAMNVDSLALDSDDETIGCDSSVAVSDYLDVFLVKRCGNLLPLLNGVLAFRNALARLRHQPDFPAYFTRHSRIDNIVGKNAIKRADIELALRLREIFFLR